MSIIQSIIRWFEVAKPKPTFADVAVQVGCHYEEVSEMLEATNNCSDLSCYSSDSESDTDTLSDLADFYKDGFGNDNVANFDRLALLDALCDQVVTAIGVGVLMGFDMASAIKEVNRSNWTKFAKDEDGRPVPYIRPDGKIGKNPETYQEPQLADYISLADCRQRAKDNLLAMLEQTESNTPAYHTDIELVGIPSVHSVLYYPLDGEEQVTVIGKVNKDELDNGNLKETNDPITPNHYKTASGVQVIDIAELFPYSLGNAIKYAWRAGKKDNLKQDLEKCEWYLNRAMANGEDSLFMSYHSSVLRARRLFTKLNKTDLPELNYELDSRILDGRLEYALTHIDDWFVGER